MLNNDLFPALSRNIALLDDPTTLNHFQLLGLFYFAGECAEQLKQNACDGNHPLWRVFATHPLIKKVVSKNSRGHPTVAVHLLALPHNPLTSSVLTSFRGEVGAEGLCALVKDLIQVDGVDQPILEKVSRKALAEAHKAGAIHNKSVVSFLLKMYNHFPLKDPALTIELAETQKDQCVFGPLYFWGEFKHTLIGRLAEEFSRHPETTARAAQTYIEHWGEDFARDFYNNAVIHWWWINQGSPSVEKVVEILDRSSVFNQWLETLLLRSDKQLSSLQQALSSCRQRLELKRQVDNACLARPARKM